VKRLIPDPIDVLLIAGVLALAAGVALIYAPAGLITLGALAIAAAIRIGGGSS
jgi:hypothetical protein